MKTQKRNKSERAFLQGCKAGMRGHSADSCPYMSDASSRGNWFSGWREGRSQFLVGYMTESPARLYKITIGHSLNG